GVRIGGRGGSRVFALRPQGTRRGWGLPDKRQRTPPTLPRSPRSATPTAAKPPPSTPPPAAPPKGRTTPAAPPRARKAPLRPHLPGASAQTATGPEETPPPDGASARRAGEPPPALLVCVPAATTLRLTLRLVIEARRLGRPMLVALNLADVARRRGIRIDRAR